MGILHIWAPRDAGWVDNRPVQIIFGLELIGFRVSGF